MRKFGLLTALLVFGFVTTAHATTVTLSAPVNATTVGAGSNVTISATATPTAGQTISKVDFYQGTTLIATDTTSPYSIVWSAVPVGSYSLTAKATTNTAAVATSTANTLTVAALPTVSLTAPANNAAFVTGSTIALAATATAAAGQTITKVDFYQGATLIASDTTSPYSVNWTGATAGSYSLTAKVTTSLGLITTSTPVAVTVAAAPTISLSAPANATTVGAGSNVTITATAAATGQTISKVDFYQGTTLLGTSTVSPYSFIWSAVPVGSYSLTAKVTTNLGLTATSAARTITVAALPTVTLTAPANNTVAAPPATFTVSATAAAAAGQTITKVDFYQGATLIASDTTSPYGISWAAVPAGSYSVTAKVTTNLGLITTSAPVTVNVAAAPTISLTAPANATNVGTGGNVTITATAAATGQTISKVDFYQGTTLLGTSTTSPYSYTWSNVATGSYSLTAKVTTNLGLVTTSAANTLNVIAAPTVSLTSPTNNATGTAPASFTLTAATTNVAAQTVSKVDFYNGATLLGTASTAPYSFTWSNVVAGSYSLTANVTGSLGSVATSIASNVTVNTLPTISLTVPANNTSVGIGSNVTLTANPVAAGQTITQVDFYNGATLLGTTTVAPYSYVWSNVAAGSYSLTAKVTSNLGLTATSAASTLNVIAAPTISLTSPANNATGTAPANFTLTANASAASGQTITQVSFYNGATLLSTSTTAPYTFNWSSVPAGSYTLTAKATDSLGSVTTSTPATITVNAPPTVSLTSPINNSTATAPASFTLTANAADSDGSIAQVDFYNGATLLGTSTTAPYSYSWNNVVAGSYSLTAQATDNLGASTTSAPISVTVNALPMVSLIAPVNPTTVGVGSNVTLTATAAVTGQTITQVDFYNGATLLGTATTSPYSFIWNNVAAGSYSLTAKVTTNLGLTTTSTISILNVAAAPAVSLTSPASNATAIAPATFTLSATTTAASGVTISKVDFYNGATLLGTAIVAPYSYTWSNVAAGSYSITAKAMDSLGSISISTPATVTVVANLPPTVSLTSPINNSSYTAAANLTLTANASDSDGSITQVVFYQGATPLATITTAPYTFNWNNVAAGNYQLLATATDNLGAVTTSSPINVTVTGAAQAMYFIETDHLNTPRQLSDAAGNTVWRWNSYDAFGNYPPNDDPNNTGQHHIFNLRMPGQYFDVETNTNHNGWRDYDQTLGAFKQSDPIGLRGGQFSTYGYVNGNPLRYVDPYGLKTIVTVWQPVGMGESSFGHVTTDINDTTYSFGPGGMTTIPTSDYVEKNGFRDGAGVELNITPKQEAALQACLSKPQGVYSATSNNCASPVQNCLKKLGIDTGSKTLPVSLGNKLLDMGITNGVTNYPASRPATGWSAPWAK